MLDRLNGGVEYEARGKEKVERVCVYVCVRACTGRASSN